ncbi:MAG TPA: DMT family transporter [Coleofasciculaceae cyanobacterium]|jgi:drug/metabolite transporter (DMT)-like permease
MRSDTVRVHAALVLVSLIYGYFYVAVKLLLRDITPPEFILLRFVLTAVIVVLIERLFIKHRLPSGSDLLKVVGLGVVGVFLVQILVVWGLHYTTAFHSALIMSTIPILTLLFGIVTRRETFNLQKMLGIVIGFAGVAILLFSKNHGAVLPPSYLVGDLIVMLNAVAFSWFLLGSQKMLQKYSAFPFMAYCYIVSAIMFSILFVGENKLSIGTSGLGFVSRLDLGNWLLIAYVVVFASIGSYTLNNYALQRVTPSIVAVYMFIQPVISAITGSYLLNEPFSIQMALATFITFAGVMLATTANHKTKSLSSETSLLPESPDEQEEEEIAPVN